MQVSRSKTLRVLPKANHKLWLRPPLEVTAHGHQVTAIHKLFGNTNDDIEWCAMHLVTTMDIVLYVAILSNGIILCLGGFDKGVLERFSVV